MANAMDADDLKHMPATEEAAAEVLDEIDVAYFVENQFDATNYELQKMLSSEFEIDELERERFKLKRQLQVVSKKVSALIMKKSAAFSNQVQHYAVIQQEAGGMVEVISGIRETLSEVRDQCRTALEIVANDRKRKLLRHLRLTLKTLKTLYETEFQLRELIQEGNFPTAIQLCVEAKNVTSQYNYFDCISDLSKNLSKTLESMESHIDDALAGLTVMFDYSRYSLVCSAYQMLNKTETAAAKLLSFFRATLESSSRGVLVEMLTNRCSVNDTDKLAYEELCEAIPLDCVADSLRELGIVLCKVLRIYHLALQFHIEEDERLLCTANISEADLDTTPIIEKGAFQTALTDGLYSTFKTASTKYNALLCCHDLSLLKFDNFIEVVEMSNRFRKSGRTYFGNACGEVAMSLEKQTCLYFAQYHRERMGELKMFLENEVFALCPVPLQFTLFDLPEFHFLKESTDAFDEDDTRVHRLLSHNGLGEQLDFKLITSDAINPFYPTMTLDNDDVTDKIEIIGPRRESSMERSSSEESNYTDNPSMKSVMPNLCNTSLSVLRLTGRYIRMTSMLHSIADQAIVSIIQIFHFFFFAMCEYFSRDADFTSFEVQFTSGRLQRLIDSSRNSLFAQDATETNGELKQKCELSPCVDINSAEGLFALAERIVAIESACFLAKQLELLRPVLESLISLRQESKTLQNFYKEVVPVVVDLRQSAYGCVVSRAINYNQIAKLISQVNWEIGEIQSQHSAYVDFIYSELSTFSKRFKHCSELVNISSEVNNIIWNLLILCIFKTIVQGYSEYGKKCSNEGRALMLLDFEQIIRELESVTGIRPIPHKAFVEDYIKAYYLPDDCLNDWIAKHQEYTNTQLISLLNTASNMSKKAKSRLMNVLEGKESAA